jgi:IclR family pca regulon transcriptional regulator
MARGPIESATSDDPLVVQSVVKAFQVLSAFDAEHSPMTLTQLCRRLGVDKSTGQRFVHTLVRLGYINKCPETKLLELSVKTMQFGYNYIRSNGLISRAMPSLIRLHQLCGETVNLSILDGTDIVFVARLTSPTMIDTGVIIGSRVGAYCSAPGRAVLSRRPREEMLEVLDCSDLRAFTPHTLADRAQLIAKIEQAALDGYTIAIEEIFLGDISIAAPIVDGSGLSIGAVNIGLSRTRYDPSEVESSFVHMLVNTASAISGFPRSRRGS